MAQKLKTLLIRAKDKNRWERRTPIVPEDLSTVVKATGARALVERSDIRFFNQSQYEAAGAIICDGMSDGEVIFGVKEIPVEKILNNKIYLFFSHTVKGQKANMPLLKKIIDSGSTLIDYEKIADANDRRLIYFGPFAGHAGAIDLLSLMGEYWGAKAVSTPLAKVKRAHQYDSVESARRHLRQIGDGIRKNGLPPSLCPFTIGILGYGNVSQALRYCRYLLRHPRCHRVQCQTD
jgi:alpha-aminoadipic semialdehyde synthase